MFARVRRGLARLNTLSVIGLALVLVVAFTLFVWHLGSLTVGLSPSESASRSGSADLYSIFNNPVNAPHRLLQNLAQAFGYHGATSMRLVSVFFALIFLVSFYLLLRYWFGMFVGTLGALMLAGTPLFIITARSATANIILLSPILVSATFVGLISARRRTNLALVALSVAIVLCLYTPGGIWFIVLLGGFCYRHLLTHIQRASSPSGALSAVLMIVLLAPLAWAVGRHWSVAQQLLLFPGHWQSWGELATASLWVPISLVWHTRTTNEFIVGRLALLSASQIALVIFGLYAMLTQARREIVALAAACLLGLALASLNNSIPLLIIILPIVSIFMAAGLRYLYVEWQTIFPKNPLPRGLATALLVILVGFQVVWGFHYAVIAWPHTAATKSTYVIK